MKPHKWAKEIKAWADGAKIEYKKYDEDEWMCAGVFPAWSYEQFEYRIKPQEQQSGCCCKQTCSAPKEPQYLCVYWGDDCSNGYHYFVSVEGLKGYKYIGKIKLEQDE